MQEYFLKIRYFGIGLSIGLKKLTLFFLLSSVPFNGQSYQKQKGSGTSDQPLFTPGYKISFLYLLIHILLSEQVWWLWNSFWVIPKITSWHKSIHDINYFTSICPFESGKCGKEEKKLQKFEYLENKKSFSDETKNIFHSF